MATSVGVMEEAVATRWFFASRGSEDGADDEARKLPSAGPVGSLTA